MRRSKLVLGFVVALGVGGLGAAAVALENDTGGADDGTTTVVDPSTTVPSTLAPTTTVAPTPDPVLSTDELTEDTEATDQGVERSTDGCDGGTYANHGDYVSSIATSPERGPGDVPAAAQSDCGKPLTAVGPPETEAPETEAPETEAPETETEAPETEAGDTGHPGQGKGRGASGK